MTRQQQRLESLAALLAVEVAAELENLPLDELVAAAPDGAAPLDDGTFTARVPAAAAPVRVPMKDLVRIADSFGAIDTYVYLQPPGAAEFVDPHGAPAQPGVLSALASGPATTHLLPAAQAERLGLPPYPAFFSVAVADGGELGTWRVAVVGSSRQEVERDRRGMLRVVIKVLVTGIAVAVFGYFAFRNFRAEMLARHGLELAEQRRAGEEVLARENRTATMLTLAAGVAHEVGTPLGLIRVKAEALRDALQDCPEEQDAETIIAQVDRLRDVVQGFLRVARGSAPEQTRAAPAALVHAVRSLIAHRFQAAEVELAVEIEPELPGVRVSPLLVEHALVNLLANACDASPRGGRVVLRARHVGREVLFEVLDDGEGVRAEDQEQLLRPFFSRKAHGTGIGLALTNEIARMHRGSVTLASREPHGAMATLRLPQEAT